jgi:hypothetical protein
VFVPITLKLIEVKNESKQVGVVDNNLPKIVMKSVSIWFLCHFWQHTLMYNKTNKWQKEMLH